MDRDWSTKDLSCLFIGRGLTTTHDWCTSGVGGLHLPKAGLVSEMTRYSNKKCMLTRVIRKKACEIEPKI